MLVMGESEMPGGDALTTTFAVSGRQTGKTYGVVQWLMKKPDSRSIVTSDVAEARRVQKLVEASLLTDPIRADWWTGQSKEQRSAWLTLHVKPWTEATGRVGLYPSTQELAVDNLDLVLSRMLHARVSLVTATGVVMPLRKASQ